jgi:hypothetical protein
MARGAVGGVPPLSLSCHTRQMKPCGFIGVAYGAGGCGGCPPVSPRHTRGYETRFHRSRPWRGGLRGVSPRLPSPHARL